MTNDDRASVLILGGYGNLGTKIAKTLRRLQPDIHLTIAGRNAEKAARFVEEIGNATPRTVDIEDANLGLAQNDRQYRAVITAVRDLSLTSYRFAQRHNMAYVALSDAAFELASLVTQFVHRPAGANAPTLILGHSMGGVPAMAALSVAREFRRVDTIEIGLLFDPADPLGPNSQVDMDRISEAGPGPLTLNDGAWGSATSEAMTRTFTGVGGVVFEGVATGLVDVLSLSAMPAATLRVDIAEGPTATTRAGGPPSHEVIIEVTGEHRDGGVKRVRKELVDPEGYAMMSARGVSVLIAALLRQPVVPGVSARLHLPETLVAPEDFMGEVAKLGLAFSEIQPA